MSIKNLTHRLSDKLHDAAGRRELARAIAEAPTEASRNELILIASR